MTNKELLEEIRMNRKAIEEMRVDLSLFKGKAFGFISVASVVFSVMWDFIKEKF